MKRDPAALAVLEYNANQKWLARIERLTKRPALAPRLSTGPPLPFSAAYSPDCQQTVPLAPNRPPTAATGIELV